MHFDSIVTMCPTKSHTLLELKSFDMRTPTCFGPYWPIIGERTLV